MRRLLVTKLGISSETTDHTHARDHINHMAFHELREWLSSDEQRGQHFTIATLHEFLPEGYEPYTRKHVKRRLLDHSQRDIVISDMEG